jgi:peptidoglycan/xylan/chitin deacetylase (PgdA/CDA1 family)
MHAILPQPSQTAVPTSPHSPTETPAVAPPLSWDALKNAVYPTTWSKDELVTLTDGEYREKYMPDSATELRISLAPLRVYGDLDGDGDADTAVILISDPGGSGTFYDLVAVLNEAGSPHPVASTFLGDRVFIRSFTIEDRMIVVELDTTGQNDSSCCPTDSQRQTYVLEDKALLLKEVVDLPDPEISARLGGKQERITFASEAVTAVVTNTLSFNGIDIYILRAMAGQNMTVTLTSPYNNVLLSVRGQDNTVLASILSEVTTWSGVLLATQDYFLSTVAVGSETTYLLQVEVAGQAVSEPTATPTSPLPTAIPPEDSNNILYFTFDDGPTSPSWTPQVLATLKRFNAKATFFTLGQNAQRYPELIQAEYEAGHSVANHTLDHQSLSGISREAFFDEVLATQNILGDRGTMCLRPPYGATDAFTRAYAAELGYQIVMWDIDTLDWKRPGAVAIVQEVLDKARPGAVVLMHDGGGDRSQTLEALDNVLSQLSAQGYRFEAICRP